MSINPEFEMRRLFKATRKQIASFALADDLTVSQWADKFRRLSPESSAETGPWRTKKTPYLKEVMDAWTNPKIRHVVMVAASQVGKSEAMNNIIGYIIDQDPGSILMIEPTNGDAKEYSKLRIAPMIRDTKTLRRKVSKTLRGDTGNTILQKSYPGGILTMCGSTEAHALASKPIRYVLGDERDRWAVEAGKEGDPWSLAMARQRTFYNAKSYECSTPTIKGYSPIEKSFNQGTRERWCSKCPHCEEYHNIRWQDIRYEFDTVEVDHEATYIVKTVYYVCPDCGGISYEHEMKRSPAKWIADNPEALRNGIRSFWLNAFCSPWVSWEKIVGEYLKARGDTNKLKVVYNTLFGELWEDRGEPGSEEKRHSVILAECFLFALGGVGKDRQRVSRSPEGHEQAEGRVQHPVRGAVGGTRRPGQRGRLPGPARGVQSGAAGGRSGAHLRRGRAG